MKKTIFILIATIYSVAFSQQKKHPLFITKHELVGTWQRGSNVVGASLNQNFVFYQDGSFILNLLNEGEDLRNLIKLKGKYRLEKDELYFTIFSKTVIDGNIEIGSQGVTFNLFQFGENSIIKEIKLPKPKEMVDPCYITLISKINIKLNNEIYYKIK